MILISCDLIGFSVEFSDGVRERIASAFDLPRENILLACTHTHSGPATAPLESLGALDPEYLLRVGPAMSRIRADPDSKGTLSVRGTGRGPDQVYAAVTRFLTFSGHTSVRNRWSAPPGQH